MWFLEQQQYGVVDYEMVIVTGADSLIAQSNADEMLKNIPTPDIQTAKLIEAGEGELIEPDTEFTYPTGWKRKGFYMDKTLKHNLDNYLIPAVHAKWDGVGLVTGIEGSAKSTNVMSVAKYLDPSFPGTPVGDNTTRRHCERVVFSAKQFTEAIDKAHPRQAIVFDEAVMGFLAADAATEIQKALIKKMVTIRKKQLYIFIVLPSIFLLRMYMAIFRTRVLIHFYTPDGISRGYFKFYSYESKRKLYISGKRDFNQDASKFDFAGRATDTSGLFFPIDEYEDKKDEAIRSIIEEPKKAKESIKNAQYVLKGQRDLIIWEIYKDQKRLNPSMAQSDFAIWLEKKYGEHFKFSLEGIRLIFNNAQRFIEIPNPEQAKIALKVEELKNKL